MNWYLFFGYAVFWILVFAYIVYLHRRQRDLGRSIQALEEALREDGRRGDSR